MPAAAASGRGYQQRPTPPPPPKPTGLSAVLGHFAVAAPHAVAHAVTSATTPHHAISPSPGDIASSIHGRASGYGNIGASRYKHSAAYAKAVRDVYNAQSPAQKRAIMAGAQARIAKVTLGNRLNLALGSIEKPYQNAFASTTQRPLSLGEHLGGAVNQAEQNILSSIGGRHAPAPKASYSPLRDPTLQVLGQIHAEEQAKKGSDSGGLFGLGAIPSPLQDPLGAISHVGASAVQGLATATLGPIGYLGSKVVSDIGQAIAQDPGGTLGNTVKTGGELALGALPAIGGLTIDEARSIVEHGDPLSPLYKVAKAFIADYSARYGPMLTGHDQQAIDRIKKEGFASEALDALGLLGGADATVGRLAAKSIDRLAPESRFAAARPELRLGGEDIRAQKLAPGIGRRTFQRMEDAARTKRWAEKVDAQGKIIRPRGQPGLPLREGEVAPFFRFHGRSMRMGISGIQARHLHITRAERHVFIDKGAAKGMRNLTPWERTAAAFAVEGYIPLGRGVAAAKAWVDRRIQQIEAERQGVEPSLTEAAKLGTTIPPHEQGVADELHILQTLRANADKWVTPRLQRFVERNGARSAALEEGLPLGYLGKETAEARRLRPIGHVLGFEHPEEWFRRVMAEGRVLDKHAVRDSRYSAAESAGNIKRIQNKLVRAKIEEAAHTARTKAGKGLPKDPEVVAAQKAERAAASAVRERESQLTSAQGRLNVEAERTRGQQRAAITGEHVAERTASTRAADQAVREAEANLATARRRHQVEVERTRGQQNVVAAREAGRTKVSDSFAVRDAERALAKARENHTRVIENIRAQRSSHRGLRDITREPLAPHEAARIYVAKRRLAAAEDHLAAVRRDVSGRKPVAPGAERPMQRNQYERLVAAERDVRQAQAQLNKAREARSSLTHPKSGERPEERPLTPAQLHRIELHQKRVYYAERRLRDARVEHTNARTHRQELERISDPSSLPLPRATMERALELWYRRVELEQALRHATTEHKVNTDWQKEAKYAVGKGPGGKKPRGDAARLAYYLERRPQMLRDYIARVREAMPKHGFHEPSYLEHAEIPREHFAEHTLGAAAAIGAPKESQFTLFRAGNIDRSPERVIDSMAKQIKAAHQWAMIDEIGRRHALPDPSPTLIRDVLHEDKAPDELTGFELARILRHQGIRMEDVQLWNPRVMRQLQHSEDAEVEGASAAAQASGSRAGGEPHQEMLQNETIQQALTDKEVFPQISTADLHGKIPEDAPFAKTTGWKVLPKDAYNEIHASMQPGSGFGRLVGKGQGLTGAAILGGSPSFLIMNSLAHAVLTAFGTRGRILADMAKMPFWWHGLSEEEKRAWMAHSGGRGHYWMPRIGAAANQTGALNSMRETFHALGDTRLGRVVRTVNPYRAFFNAEDLQSNFFRRVVVYHEAKRMAMNNMVHDMPLMQNLASRLAHTLNVGPKDEMAAILHSQPLAEELGRNLVNFLGDYTRFTSFERKWINNRAVLFYSFLRHATRTLLYVLPIGHPIALALTAELAKLHNDEVKKMFGGAEMPWLFSRLFFHHKDGTLTSIDFARSSPVGGLATDVATEGLKGVANAFTPAVQTALDMIYGHTPEGAPVPADFMSGVNQLASLSYPYRLFRDLHFGPAAQQADSVPFIHERPQKYKTASAQAYAAQKAAQSKVGSLGQVLGRGLGLYPVPDNSLVVAAHQLAKKGQSGPAAGWGTGAAGWNTASAGGWGTNSAAGWGTSAKGWGP
jgi:hypothetical protein